MPRGKYAVASKRDAKLTIAHVCIAICAGMEIFVRENLRCAKSMIAFAP